MAQIFHCDENASTETVQSIFFSHSFDGEKKGKKKSIVKTPFGDQKRRRNMSKLFSSSASFSRTINAKKNLSLSFNFSSSCVGRYILTPCNGPKKLGEITETPGFQHKMDEMRLRTAAGSEQHDDFPHCMCLKFFLRSF